MLRIKNLTKVYESTEYKVEALKDVSICFRNEEFVSILGPSGCGKTTLLNIIGGLDRYTSGDISISGISTKHFSDQHWDAYRNNSVGFVFQNYNLIPHLSILDNVALTLSLTGVNKTERINRSKEVLSKVGLANQYNKLPSQLSGGQMQRVAIARALINKPDVILADEPTGALDSELSIQVMEILKEISKDTLVIMVTHNETLANTYSTRIINILDGEVVGDTNPFSISDAISGDIDSINELDVSLAKKNQLLKMLAKEMDSEKDAEILSRVNQLINLNKLVIEEELKTKSKFKKYLEKKKKDKKRIVMPFKSTSMQYKTAIALSLKNLNSKRRRTVLTTFAGSIGIVSLALVLALSWGYQQYLSKMQKNVLASVPVSVYEYTMSYQNFTKMFDGIDGSRVEPVNFDGKVSIERKEGVAGLGKMLDQLLKSFGRNNLSEEYLDYVMNMNKKYYDSITVMHGNQFNLVAKSKNYSGEEAYRDVSKTPDITAMLNIGTSVMGEQGLQSTNWHQLVGNEKYMTSYYNVVAGSYPKAKDEIVLVINNENKVDFSAFEELGLDVYERDETGKIIYEKALDNEGNETETFDYKKPKIRSDISKDELINNLKLGEIRLIRNDDYYKEHIVDGNVAYAQLEKFSTSSIDSEDSLEEYKENNQKQQTNLEEMFAKGMNLKIVGILKPNPNNLTMGSIVGNHLCYTSELAEYVYNDAISSNVAKAQIEFINNDTQAILPGKTLNAKESAYLDAKFKSIIKYTFLGDNYTELSNRDITFEDGDPLPFIGKGLQATAELQRIGAIKNPKYISIYAKDFDAKNNVINYLNAYNENVPYRDQIVHFDMSEMFIQNIRTVMKLMTIVLLALASISLIVSSIMIGIITGNSVYERTREIGMMRALGARKQDIARVFNTETALIGFFSGLLGIVIPYIVIPFINWGLKIRFGIASVLLLNPLHAFILLLLSMLLTFIAGIIPSQIAAKRDIVRSLRTE